MANILTIFIQILLPIFLVIIAGFLLHRKFDLNIGTMTKVQLYAFIPALIFSKIATSQLEGHMVVSVMSYTAILFFILMVISYLVAKLLHLDHKKEKAFMNAVILRNQGNFGIPLITLVFALQPSGNTYALSIHMIVLFMTNILLNTIGLYNISSGTYSKKEALIKVLRLPMIYVVILGFIFKGFHLTIPSPIFSTLDIMGQGVVPLALFTLGAQLANTHLRNFNLSVFISVFLRLVASPLVAALLVLPFGFDSIVSKVLIIGASAPSAVNSVLLAIEFNGDSEFASQSVFLTTLLSTITVALTIQLVM